MLPLVSVVIPVYNRQATIQRAVDSVLNQTYSNIEVLVVDDGSTDNSLEMLKKYDNDNRVKIFCQKLNQGANAARNRGIREAKGEYIAFHDSDDEWLPEKLEKQIGLMEKSKYNVSFCAYKIYYAESTQIIPNITKKISSGNIRSILKTKNIVGTPTLVVHRSVITEVGIFDEEMPRLQDYEYIIRIIKKYNILFVNEPLVRVYQLEGCISLNQEKLRKAYALLLIKHADFLDIDYIWGEYLASGSEIKNQDIDWIRLEQDIDGIISYNEYCTRERLYKATIQYLHTKCFRILQYEDNKYNLLLNRLINNKFVVYGAGYYARQAVASLKKVGLFPECFLVTTKDGTDCIDKIPVIQLSEWTDRETYVIIAVSGVAQRKIMENLNKEGIYNYYIYRECY